jgi:hypothetical protein
MAKPPRTWPEAAALARRFLALGLTRVAGVEAHENRTVMVSLDRRGVLRVHRAYLFAPDAVLQAIIRFVTPRTPRAVRLRAQRELLAFPVSDYVPAPAAPALRERPRPEDQDMLRRLGQLCLELNREHFQGRLPAIPIRLSRRMRTRLGELTLEDRTGRPVEIAMARRHVERDLWSEVRQTLLHELVHLWQADVGLAVDHGPAFRRKAREVGIEPSALRTMPSRRRAARYA